jgi:uncharacterized RDD family membrane protein YckC
VICPSCRADASPVHDRCPACGASYPPPVEGSLAPDPLAVGARGRVEPLREIPGLRRKERTWKDEVRERVQKRRRTRSGDKELPLFPGDGDVAAGEDDPGGACGTSAPSGESGAPADEVEPELFLRPLGDADGDADRDGEPTADPADSRGDYADTDSPGAAAEPPGGLAEDDPEEPWTLDRAAPPALVRPVERPARVVERAQAGVLDFGLLLGLWALVTYFASRAAHVPVRGLGPSWPYLLGYLGFLGLIYAVYFTGTTGQTLGKILYGLRVVDSAGRPPGYVRSLGRACVGVAGLLLGFAGSIPMFFDPARRAFHDRLLKTRVVKS